MSKTKIEPNGLPEQCQCVRNHDTLVDGDWEQCASRRWTDGSNLYCKNCEKTHGDALSKKVK